MLNTSELLQLKKEIAAGQELCSDNAEEVVDTALCIRNAVLEEAAAVCEELERKEWEAVGHPMMRVFVPYKAIAIRALKKEVEK